ncbi:MAG TPA: hypothetical protein EYG57_05755 [Planctomycetes bacterium]|nr:hypothetical protein [Planctomycetota bacterium]
MAFTKNYDEPAPVEHQPCIFLRSKAIYVTGELCNPDHPDEAGSQYCWCNLTQHVMGPDDQDVCQLDCSPDRPCYKEHH